MSVVEPVVPAPLVSVVMIFRDAEWFLAEAVTSVLAQTHPRLELLLVDDGSTDGSRAIARARADAATPRVRLLSHPGQQQRGTGPSRNLGIQGARGDLVAFLDADDVWDPAHLEHEVGLLLDHPEADLVCGRAQLWHSWAPTPASPDHWSQLAFAPGTLVPPPRMLAATLRRGAFTTPTCSLLVRAAALRAAGGAEEAFPALFEDQALLAKLHLTSTSVISGSLTAKYRQHPDSATARARQAGEYDPVLPNPSRGAYLDWLDARPELQHGTADPDLRAALDAALAVYRRPVHRPALRERVASMARPGAKRLARAVVPRRLRPCLRELVQPTRPGRVRMGVLGRLEPLSRQAGYDRGLPVDRWPIERFLAQNAENIRGRVLEVGDSSYTERFGGSRVTRADVLNVRPDPGTTFVADLADAPNLPDEAFDCLIVTQTLQLVYDLPAAVRTLHRILRPGGTLLLTVPGITPVSDANWAPTWYWSFTPLAVRRLLGQVFADEDIDLHSWGNVLAAVAFLEGMAAEELPPAALDHVDPHYPVLVAARALRPRLPER